MMTAVPLSQSAEDLSASKSIHEPALIRRAAVLGAGTMGSRIAAHLANAGVPVLLLDLIPAGETVNRNRLAAGALEGLLKSKPAAFYDASAARLITVGNFEDDLPKLANCDWVIEVVMEDLAVKQTLLSRLIPHLAPTAILTTNTSGLPVASIAEGLPEEFRAKGLHKRWFGTHFFNPPRYMRLVELIPTPDTDLAVAASLAAFLDRRLGKQVVYSRDTPNFIANRIGVFTMFASVELMQQQSLSIEEVDALTGSILGWPRTGTFRLADMVGVDILAHVAENFRRLTGQGGAELPSFLKTMLERRWLGDKTGQGFYKKERDAEGKEQRFALDLSTMEYRPLARAKLASLEMAKNAEALTDRIKVLLDADLKRDKAAAFQWPLLAKLWNYSAATVGEAAASIAAVDQAMRAGFNWEMGPFELWDSAGFRSTAQKMQAMGVELHPNALALLTSGKESWYRDGNRKGSRECFNPVTGQYEALAIPDGVARIANFRSANGVLKKNAGASLIDIGDGIACLELHSVKSAIGDDIVSMVTQVFQPQSEFVRNFRGFVLSSDAENFSVGANLIQLLLAMQDGEWEEVDFAIRAFQRMTAAIKFCPRPVVVAPYALCLGGGVEISLHGARRQAHAELYMGLVETGVGLVPGGGGTKELALKATDNALRAAAPSPKDPPAKFAQSAELQSALKQSLETIAMARVSTSAEEARGLGFLSPVDAITLNRDRLLLDARATAAEIADNGYAAPIERTAIPVAGSAVLSTLELGVYLMRQGNFISEHDQKVANKVAGILCGGPLTPGTLVSEQYFLDLEREAFLSLCGERKTQERIAFTLKVGKPLRN
jgi:3-hydroxyacyl-CoA dehydrogenase